VLRGAVVAVAVALMSVVAGPSGFWACVPGALVLAAASRSGVETALGAALAVAAAAAPRLSGPPSPLLGLAVAGASVAVLHGLRLRLESERETMRRSALRDPLTGLCNRRGLDERIGYEAARHARERRRFAVVAIDLDGFKAVNDRFGHAAGDEVLRDVADALADAVREQDTVARLGGDEFCVLAPETGRGGAKHLAAKIERAIAQSASGLEAVSGSVGVAIFPDDGRDALSVLEAADDAQVDAKRRSRASRDQGRRHAA
jgi:diguanylate cyclase (GGDEF)-like protein